jgi:hypothetical protein
VIAFPNWLLALAYGFDTGWSQVGIFLAMVLWIVLYVLCSAVLMGSILRGQPKLISDLEGVLLLRIAIGWGFLGELLTGVLSAEIVDRIMQLHVFSGLIPAGLGSPHRSPGLFPAFLMTLTQGALITFSLALMIGALFVFRTIKSFKNRK